MFALCDVLTPNRGEATVLAGLGEDAELGQIVEVIRSRHRGVLAITLGERGAALVGTGGPEWTVIPALPPLQVVDTTGAGDAFNAALAVALAEGQDPQAATRFANAAGSCAVARRGVIPSLPRRAQLLSAHPYLG